MPKVTITALDYTRYYAITTMGRFLLNGDRIFQPSEEQTVEIAKARYGEELLRVEQHKVRVIHRG